MHLNCTVALQEIKVDPGPSRRNGMMPYLLNACTGLRLAVQPIGDYFVLVVRGPAGGIVIHTGVVLLYAGLLGIPFAGPLLQRCYWRWRIGSLGGER